MIVRGGFWGTRRVRAERCAGPVSVHVGRRAGRVGEQGSRWQRTETGSGVRVGLGGDPASKFRRTKRDGCVHNYRRGTDASRGQM